MATTAASRRLPTLDVLRGIAILGILLANIPFFAYPSLKEMLLYVPRPQAGLDLLIDQWHTFLVNGKFRGMLCVLFGAGMWLQYKKLSANRPDWQKIYTRRMGLLFVIGCVHGFFIWYGDILAVYSITALLSFWLAKYETPTLWKIIGGLAGFALISGLVFMSLPSSGTMDLGGSDPASKWMAGAIAGESTAYASGTYALQFVYRAVLFLGSLLSAAFLAPILAMLFLLGIVLTREGIFQRPSENPALRNRLLIAAAVVGIPLNGAALFISDSSQLAGYQMLVEMFGGAWLAVLYLTLTAMAMESRWGQWIFRPFQNVGKIALTTYLSQSVICSFIFYSWGMGLFDELNRAQLLQVVGLVWIWNIVFAAVYLRFFDIGPVEWVWRSWAARRKLPWREVPAPAPPPVLPTS